MNTSLMRGHFKWITTWIRKKCANNSFKLGRHKAESSMLLLLLSPLLLLTYMPVVRIPLVEYNSTLPVTRWSSWELLLLLLFGLVPNGPQRENQSDVDGKKNKTKSKMNFESERASEGGQSIGQATLSSSIIFALPTANLPELPGVPQDSRLVVGAMAQLAACFISADVLVV